MLDIRWINSKDIGGISSVLAASWKTAYRGIVDDEYLDSLKDNHWVSFLSAGLSDKSIFSAVMTEDGVLIGAAILCMAEQENEANIISFYLSPDKIGQGYGHRFYKWIENELTGMGIFACTLDVLENNKRAFDFYTAHGFSDTGRKVTVTLGEQDYACAVLKKSYADLTGNDTLRNFQIRFAVEEDTPLILKFIRELAEYERMLDEVLATEDLLREWLFEKEKAEVLIGELDGEPVAFALFFYNFSTFVGRPGIYLEDLYVRPYARGNGIGKKMLRYIAKIAFERKCGRLEWQCLDWNKDSISFYLKAGARVMDDWTTYRLSGDTLANLAKG